MSEELKLKVGIDMSEWQKAADQLPDAIERSGRKSKSAAKTDAETEAWHRKDLSRRLKELGEEARAAEAFGKAELSRKLKEIEEQKKAEERAAKEMEAFGKSELRRKLKEIEDNKKAEERAAKQKAAEQEKAAKEASRAAMAEQKAQGKVDAETEAWHKKDLARRLKEIGQQRAAEEKAAKQKAEDQAKEARKDAKQAEKDAKDLEAWNRKNLALKLNDIKKQREAEERAAKQKQAEIDKAAKAKDWTDEFGKRLASSLFGAITPIAAMIAVLRAGWNAIQEQARTTETVRGTQERTGMSARDTRMARILADNLTSGMTEEQGQQMGEDAYAKMREYALGLSSEGQRGFQSFGFDREKFLKGEQGYVDLLANMSDAYLEYGNSAKFAVEAESIFGKNWTALRPILASGRRVITTDPMGGSVTPSDLMNPEGLNTINAQRIAHGLPPISSMMGGGAPTSPLPQLLSNVTSLQAMGGGDVLSAIARGPQDRIADNTERTANAVEKMANPPANAQPIPTVLK